MYLRFRSFLTYLKVIALLAGLLLSTHDIFARFSILLVQHKFFTFLALLLLWGLALVALFVVAFHPSWKWRAFWGVLLAFNAAATFGYFQASGSEITAFDMITFWVARHEAGRAISFYFPVLLQSILLFGGLFAAFLLPSCSLKYGKNTLIKCISLLPLLPMLIVSGIVTHRPRGTQGVPGYFTVLPLMAVSGYKLSTLSFGERSNVTWHVGASQAQKIVYLVDESIRGDYLNWTPNNNLTPQLAELSPYLIDFGRMTSGGNCSHTSNALLRFMVSPAHFDHTLKQGPTLWQYAKKAGFRTVYIDGQGAYLTGGGKLQNYMTLTEKAEIDDFYTLTDQIPSWDFDNEVIKIIQKELKRPGKVLIYANKNGAHFPYDLTYPESQRFFKPTLADVPSEETPLPRINSYKNSIRWSLGRDIKAIVQALGPQDILLYTSDHGQNLNNGHLTHCTSEHSNSVEALVPFIVGTHNRTLYDIFSEEAQVQKNATSHFQIAPTMLSLLGYNRKDITTVYSSTLWDLKTSQTQFVTGDIFGIFDEPVLWHPTNFKNFSP